MKVILIPMRLQLASALILLSIPLAGIQVILISGAPWWDLPYRRMGLACAVAAALFVPLAYWIARGRKWALWLSGVIGAVWFAVTLASALHMRGFWLGLFVVFLGSYWLALKTWLNRETGKSFFDPKMNWYHGSPEKVSDLWCQLEGVEAPFRVCRLDREGVFVFAPRPQSGEPFLKRRRVGLKLTFRGREFKGEGTFVRALGAGRGYGLRFDGVPPDGRKELGDFVEALKGEGYV